MTTSPSNRSSYAPIPDVELAEGSGGDTYHGLKPTEKRLLESIDLCIHGPLLDIHVSTVSAEDLSLVGSQSPHCGVALIVPIIASIMLLIVTTVCSREAPGGPLLVYSNFPFIAAFVMWSATCYSIYQRMAKVMMQVTQSLDPLQENCNARVDSIVKSTHDRIQSVVQKLVDLKFGPKIFHNDWILKRDGVQVPHAPNVEDLSTTEISATGEIVKKHIDYEKVIPCRFRSHAQYFWTCIFPVQILCLAMQFGCMLLFTYYLGVRAYGFNPHGERMLDRETMMGGNNEEGLMQEATALLVDNSLSYILCIAEAFGVSVIQICAVKIYTSKYAVAGMINDVGKYMNSYIFNLAKHDGMALQVEEVLVTKMSVVKTQSLECISAVHRIEEYADKIRSQRPVAKVPTAAKRTTPPKQKRSMLNSIPGFGGKK